MMTHYRLDFHERLRCLLAAAVFLAYTTLSILLIAALVSDWPSILHNYGPRMGPW
jgi:hypothetical protein